MAATYPSDFAGGATAASAPAATHSVGFRTKTTQALANGTVNNQSFLDVAAGATNYSGGGAGSTLSDQSRVANEVLAKLPDLDPSEVSRVKSCFAAVLGEGRENIVNGFELRVVFSELGIYPSETELSLILRAYRNRVNLVTLTQYLRLYKKEMWINNLAAAAAATAEGAHGTSRDAKFIAQNYTAFSVSGPPAAAVGGGGGGADEETLKAFVDLGGNADGSGEIPASVLADAIRGFELTIDIDAMIRAVDVHNSGMLDYVDFKALWSNPTKATADSGGADHAHRPQSTESMTSDVNQRLLFNTSTVSQGSSIVAYALRRRSQTSSNTHEQNGMAPQAGARPSMTRNRKGSTARNQWMSSIGPGNRPGDGKAFKKIVSSPPPAPITDEEHMLLVNMYLFPEQSENALRRTLHFADDKGGEPLSYGITGIMGNASNGNFGDPRSLSDPTHQKRISRANPGAPRSRSPHQARNMKSNSRTRRSPRKTDKNGGHVEGINTLAAEFFSPKNQNVYRPPSPTILSMRNSAAHRNRLKRLEEQNRLRTAGKQSPGAAASQRQLRYKGRNSHSLTTARSGGESSGDFETINSTSV